MTFLVMYGKAQLANPNDSGLRYALNEQRAERPEKRHVNVPLKRVSWYNDGPIQTSIGV
jgi:hypothetical protein